MAQQWKDLRTKHSSLLSFGTLAISSAVTLALPPVAWWLGGLALGAFLSVGVGFLALVGSVVCWLGFMMGIGIVASDLYGHWSVSKQFNHSQSKQAAREYIQEKHTMQYVKHMVPHLTNEELELLLQYPHTQAVYKNLIKKEQEKRKREHTAEQIKQTFTVSVDQPVTPLENDVVAVQTPRSLNL